MSNNNTEVSDGGSSSGPPAPPPPLTIPSSPDASIPTSPSQSSTRMRPPPIVTHAANSASAAAFSSAASPAAASNAGRSYVPSNRTSQTTSQSRPSISVHRPIAQQQQSHPPPAHPAPIIHFSHAQSPDVNYHALRPTESAIEERTLRQYDVQLHRAENAERNRANLFASTPYENLPESRAESVVSHWKATQHQHHQHQQPQHRDHNNATGTAESGSLARQIPQQNTVLTTKPSHVHSLSALPGSFSVGYTPDRSSAATPMEQLEILDEETERHLKVIDYLERRRNSQSIEPAQHMLYRGDSMHSILTDHSVDTPTTTDAGGGTLPSMRSPHPSHMPRLHERQSQLLSMANNGSARSIETGDLSSTPEKYHLKDVNSTPFGASSRSLDTHSVQDSRQMHQMYTPLPGLSRSGSASRLTNESDNSDDSHRSMTAISKSGNQPSSNVGGVSKTPNKRKKRRGGSSGSGGSDSRRHSQRRGYRYNDPWYIKLPHILRHFREGYSLWLFSHNNRFRQLITFIVDHWIFQTLIILTIIFNLILLAMDTVVASWSHTAELVFTILFLAEFGLKLVAQGLIMDKKAYMRSAWNILDFMILVASTVAFFFGHQTRPASVVRVFRVLRPVARLSQTDGLQRLRLSLTKSIRPLGTALGLLGLFFCLFALISVSIFQGKLSYYCVDNNTGLATDQHCGSSSSPCDPGFSCIDTGVNPFNGLRHFDNVPVALVTLFSITTLDKWAELMYITMDSTHWAACFFFVFVVVCNAFFVMNLAFAIIRSGFEKLVVASEVKKENLARQEALKEIARQDRERARIRRNRKRPYGTPEEPPEFIPDPWYILPVFQVPWFERNIRAHVMKIGRNSWVDGFFFFMTFLNICFLASEFDGQPQYWTDFLHYANIILTVIFTVEFVIKWITLGIIYYWIESFLNILDFIVVAVGLMEFAFSGSGSLDVIKIVRIFRMARILRVLKMVGRLEGLSRLVEVVVRSMHDIGYTGLFLTLFMGMYATMGMYIFGDNFYEFDKVTVPRTNFQSFPTSLFLCFQLLTLDDWVGPMYNAIASFGWFAAVYFCSWIVLGVYILLNIFVAIIVTSFEIEQAKLAKVKMERLKRKKLFLLYRKAVFDNDNSDMEALNLENPFAAAKPTKRVFNPFVKQGGMLFGKLGGTGATPKTSIVGDLGLNPSGSEPQTPKLSLEEETMAALKRSSIKGGGMSRTTTHSNLLVRSTSNSNNNQQASSPTADVTKGSDGSPSKGGGDASGAGAAATIAKDTVQQQTSPPKLQSHTGSTESSTNNSVSEKVGPLKSSPTFSSTATGGHVIDFSEPNTASSLAGPVTNAASAIGSSPVATANELPKSSGAPAVDDHSESSSGFPSVKPNASPLARTATTVAKLLASAGGMRPKPPSTPKLPTPPKVTAAPSLPEDLQLLPEFVTKQDETSSSSGGRNLAQESFVEMGVLHKQVANPLPSSSPIASPSQATIASPSLEVEPIASPSFSTVPISSSASATTATPKWVPPPLLRVGSSRKGSASQKPELAKSASKYTKSISSASSSSSSDDDTTTAENSRSRRKSDNDDSNSDDDPLNTAVVNEGSIAIRIHDTPGVAAKPSAAPAAAAAPIANISNNGSLPSPTPVHAGAQPVYFAQLERLNSKHLVMHLPTVNYPSSADEDSKPSTAANSRAGSFLVSPTSSGGSLLSVPPPVQGRSAVTAAVQTAASPVASSVAMSTPARQASGGESDTISPMPRPNASPAVLAFLQRSRAAISLIPSSAAASSSTDTNANPSGSPTAARNKSADASSSAARRSFSSSPPLLVNEVPNVSRTASSNSASSPPPSPGLFNPSRKSAFSAVVPLSITSSPVDSPLQRPLLPGQEVIPQARTPLSSTFASSGPVRPPLSPRMSPHPFSLQAASRQTLPFPPPPPPSDPPRIPPPPYRGSLSERNLLSAPRIHDGGGYSGSNSAGSAASSSGSTPPQPAGSPRAGAGAMAASSSNAGLLAAASSSSSSSGQFVSPTTEIRKIVERDNSTLLVKPHLLHPQRLNSPSPQNVPSSNSPLRRHPPLMRPGSSQSLLTVEEAPSRRGILKGLNTPSPGESGSATPIPRDEARPRPILRKTNTGLDLPVTRGGGGYHSPNLSPGGHISLQSSPMLPAETIKSVLRSGSSTPQPLALPGASGVDEPNSASSFTRPPMLRGGSNKMVVFADQKPSNAGTLFRAQSQPQLLNASVSAAYGVNDPASASIKESDKEDLNGVAVPESSPPSASRKSIVGNSSFSGFRRSSFTLGAPSPSPTSDLEPPTPKIDEDAEMEKAVRDAIHRERRRSIMSPSISTRRASTLNLHTGQGGELASSPPISPKNGDPTKVAELNLNQNNNNNNNNNPEVADDSEDDKPQWQIELEKEIAEDEAASLRALLPPPPPDTLSRLLSLRLDEPYEEPRRPVSYVPYNYYHDHIFARHEWFRILSHLCFHKYFEYFIIVFVLASSLSLTLENASLDKTQGLGHVLWIMDYVYLTIFVTEMFMKVLCMGLYGMPDAYMENSWNCLDFVIVVTSILDVTIDTGSFHALRALRVLRPLRLINRNGGMRSVVDTIVRSFWPMFNVVFLLFVAFLTFGILGIKLWGGKMAYCSIGEADSQVLQATRYGLNNSYVLSLDKYGCLNNTWNGATVWEAPRKNFDNILNAVVTLFSISTLQNWGELCYATMDITGTDTAPVVNSQSYMAIFFVAFIFLVPWVLNGLYVGVVFDTFVGLRDESSGLSLLSESQKLWVQSQMKLLEAELQMVPRTPYESRIRTWCFHLIFHPKFEKFIVTCVVVNVFIMGITYKNEPSILTNFREDANVFFFVVYMAEMVVKVTALYPKLYFRDMWNRFDFIIVLGSAAEVILTLSTSNFKNAVMILKLFRIFRLFRVIKGLDRVQVLLRSLYLSLPKIANVAFLLLFIFFVFGIAGVQLFGHILEGQCIGRDVHYHNFLAALLTLFRISSGQDWDCLMFDCLDPSKGGTWLSIPFYFFFLLGVNFICLSLFIAVLLDNLSLALHHAAVAAARQQRRNLMLAFQKQSHTIEIEYAQDELGKKQKVLEGRMLKERKEQLKKKAKKKAREEKKKQELDKKNGVKTPPVATPVPGGSKHDPHHRPVTPISTRGSMSATAAALAAATPPVKLSRSQKEELRDIGRREYRQIMETTRVKHEKAAKKHHHNAAGAKIKSDKEILSAMQLSESDPAFMESLIGEYVQVWQSLDPDATHFVPVVKLPEILRRLDTPLGVGPNGSIYKMIVRCAGVTLRKHRFPPQPRFVRCVHFSELLHGLLHYLFGTDVPEGLTHVTKEINQHLEESIGIKVSEVMERDPLSTAGVWLACQAMEELWLSHISRRAEVARENYAAASAAQKKASGKPAVKVPHPHTVVSQMHHKREQQEREQRRQMQQEEAKRKASLSNFYNGEEEDEEDDDESDED